MSIRNQCMVLLGAAFMAAAPAILVGAIPQPAAAQPQEQPAAANPPAASAPPAEAPMGKEVVENPYGPEAMWKGGDFITKGVLIILGIMSFGSWYIMVTKLFEQFKLMRQARQAQQTFWTAKTVKDGMTGLKEGSAFRYIAETGINATEHHEGAMLEQIDLNTWITMSVQRAMENIQNRLQDGLAFLATVGSTAPFVGLFGTVWGIYHALTAIGIAGQASIDKVAGPVGEALIMTAVGLAVAVPAVLGYNWLVRRNKVAMESVRTFGADLHMVVLGASSKQMSNAPAAKK
ncbi:MAG TPA: MotA/TolQ/ExbB proton channel family protein [Burkholderiaceae bacterium]|nr:MotA/TolQ/ExbB proton channel family protein [Burkholderiaceae bacterium]